MGRAMMGTSCLMLAVLAAVVVVVVDADIYLHVPRGSNNRLNENTATRKNPNRVFDSQNNNRGGYNVGDAGDEASKGDASKQYNMKYFQSGPDSSKGPSHLTIEWTSQHGCGGNENTSPQKQNCNFVLQYMCHDDENGPDEADQLRNGVVTNAQDYTQPNKNNVDKLQDRKNSNVKDNRVLHETWDWYNKCYLRDRNMGLFTADQKLAKNKLAYSSAIYTRQNPTGNRYGYECPEERDYFPYWHPTAWKDIAVLAENASMCSHYQSKSFNVQPYEECRESKGWSRYNNQKECEDAGGDWHLLYNYLEKAPGKTNKNACERTKTAGLVYKWAVAYDSKDHKAECLVMLKQPDCMEAPWARSNHLGNGRDGVPLNYTWTLPYFPSMKTKRCVYRMRYNISTDDYDPYKTDYKQNDKFPIKSPIQQNPYVYVMGKQTPLRLAVNTAQYGRVFQDRSHVFLLRPRPSGLSQGRIFNLNVRGKRGNIVQVYPAVEYDFTPNRLVIKENDMVHVQWTGSNTHNNNNPAGDGQAGSAGEGQAGTDRNNFVELTDRSSNYPTPFEQSTIFDGHTAQIAWIYHGKTGVSMRDLAINMASSGYYRCASKIGCGEREHKDYLVSTKDKMNNLLNNAPASYEGVLLRFTKKGVYNYMCTRNNNFTNRSQKGAIVVV